MNTKLLLMAYLIAGGTFVFCMLCLFIYFRSSPKVKRYVLGTLGVAAVCVAGSFLVIFSIKLIYYFIVWAWDIL